ncbi:MAG: hypothetical protein U1E45_13380 [Geminicoccaceae bacterium]
MKWPSSVACAALIAGTMPAAADIMASPPMYGSSSQAYAVCYVFNAGITGTTAIPIDKFFLWSASTKTASASRGNCPTSLPAFRTCQAIFPITSSGAYSCRVSLSGKANARSSVEFRDAYSRVLNRADLR